MEFDGVLHWGIRVSLTKHSSKKRLAFVGGEHVHLISLENANHFSRAGAGVTLIGPDRFLIFSVFVVGHPEEEVGSCP